MYFNKTEIWSTTGCCRVEYR